MEFRYIIGQSYLGLKEKLRKANFPDYRRLIYLKLKNRNDYTN